MPAFDGASHPKGSGSASAGWPEARGEAVSFFVRIPVPTGSDPTAVIGRLQFQRSTKLPPFLNKWKSKTARELSQTTVEEIRTESGGREEPEFF